MGWTAQVKQAEKILGQKGKIPPPDGDVVKADKHLADLHDEFVEDRDKFSDISSRLATYISYYNDKVEKFRAVVAKDNLGLDPNNKDDAKKIGQAKDILLGWIDDQVKASSADAGAMKELRKHVDNMNNYSGPQCSDPQNWPKR